MYPRFYIKKSMNSLSRIMPNMPNESKTNYQVVKMSDLHDELYKDCSKVDLDESQTGPRKEIECNKQTLSMNNEKKQSKSEKTKLVKIKIKISNMKSIENETENNTSTVKIKRNNHVTEHGANKSPFQKIECFQNETSGRTYIIELMESDDTPATLDHNDNSIHNRMETYDNDEEVTTVDQKTMSEIDHYSNITCEDVLTNPDHLYKFECNTFLTNEQRCNIEQSSAILQTEKYLISEQKCNMRDSTNEQGKFIHSDIYNIYEKNSGMENFNGMIMDNPLSEQKNIETPDAASPKVTTKKEERKQIDCLTNYDIDIDKSTAKKVGALKSFKLDDIYEQLHENCKSNTVDHKPINISDDMHTKSYNIETDIPEKDNDQSYENTSPKKILSFKNYNNMEAISDNPVYYIVKNMFKEPVKDNETSIPDLIKSSIINSSTIKENENTIYETIEDVYEDDVIKPDRTYLSHGCLELPNNSVNNNNYTVNYVQKDRQESLYKNKPRFVASTPTYLQKNKLLLTNHKEDQLNSFTGRKQNKYLETIVPKKCISSDEKIKDSIIIKDIVMKHFEEALDRYMQKSLRRKQTKNRQLLYNDKQKIELEQKSERPSSLNLKRLDCNENCSRSSDSGLDNDKQKMELQQKSETSSSLNLKRLDCNENCSRSSDSGLDNDKQKMELQQKSERPSSLNLKQLDCNENCSRSYNKTPDSGLDATDELYYSICNASESFKSSNDTLKYSPTTFLKEALGEEYMDVTYNSQQENSEKYYSTPLPTPNTVERSIRSSEISTLVSTTDGVDSLYSTVDKSRKKRPSVLKNASVIRPLFNSSSSNNYIYESIDDWKISSKTEELNTAVSVQSAVVAQISKALSFCKNSPIFFGSVPHLEAEKCLLFATHKKEMLENQLNREYEEMESNQCYGLVTIENLIFSLDTTETRNLREYYMCLVHSDVTLFASEIVVPDINGDIIFRESFQFNNLSPDFAIHIKIFSMRLQNNLHKKKNYIPRPCMIYPTRKNGKIYNRHTHNQCETSSFELLAKRRLEISDMRSIFFTLNKVIPNGRICNTFRADFHSSIKLNNKVQGFLTIGTTNILWNRRWCILDGSMFKYWNYPGEENIKEPIGVFNLMDCTIPQINSIDRAICSRPRTFMLKILSANGVVNQYFFQADNTLEFEEWKRQLNFVLISLCNWKCSK